MVVGLVPGSYFDVLRIRPLMGRLFTEEETQYGKHYVAAVSGNSSALGKSRPVGLGESDPLGERDWGPDQGTIIHAEGVFLWE
jgi:hypothetical protein